MNITQTIGTKPLGAATGRQASLRWATITEDDGTITITAYRGWGITDEVRLSGRTAVALVESITAGLLEETS